VRLDELQRDDDAAREIYDSFLTRYKEAIAKEGTQQADARMVSPAKLPTSASKPNKKLDLVIALALGLVAGSLAVLLAELLARGISNSTEIEEIFGLPALAEIPTLRSTLDAKLRRTRAASDPVAYVAAKPLSRFAEAFRNMRTSVLSSRTGQPVKVVAITSSLPGEGKTTTALCLARTIALSGASVVLVDCDLRQRSVNRILAAEPTVGLLEVLNGTATLEQALVRDKDSGALLLPLTKSAFTPRDVFGSAAMAQLLGELRRHFEVVLLDTAPVLAVADTRVLCPQADAVVLLTRWRRTSRKAVQSALHALSGDTFVAGIALTNVNLREQALAGEGAAHYYRAYRKYYTG
jgi:succinoglycan biosynthesis transport protein ExoP